MGRHAAERQRVARLEAEARRSPQAFTRKLVAMAVLGYGALLFGVLLLFVLPVALLLFALFGGVGPHPGLAFLLLPLLAGYGLVRALWFRVGAPQGLALREGEAPALRAQIERIRGLVGAPPLAAIHIDGELNAALVTVPRMAGMLGHRYHLVLGLPLLRLLDHEELSAVIAHEFGHAQAGTAGVDGWLHRMRISLLRTLQADDDGPRTSYGYVMWRLLAWYAPYLEAFAHVRSREYEFQADAVAARATSPEIEASTSLRIALAEQRHAAHGLASLQAMARHQSHPPAQPQAWLDGVVARERGADPARILAIAAREQDTFDTHPSLERRLAAVGVDPRLRAPGPSAVALLGDAADRLERALDMRWRDGVRGQWSAWHADAEAGRARLVELEALPRFDLPQALEHATLAATLRHDADAIALHRRVVDADGDSAMAHLRWANALLDGGDAASAMAAFERVLVLEPEALRAVHGALDARWRDPDLDPATVAAIQPLRERLAAQAKAQDLRDGIDHGDTGDDGYLPHGLDDTALATLRRSLAVHPKIARAWAVRRRLDMAEATPHYIVLVDWRGSVASEAAGLAKLKGAVKLPGTHTVCTGTNDQALQRAIQARAGGPVYQR